MIVNSLWVAAGGFMGAVARYTMGQWMGKRLSSAFPFGTFIVNVSGSFLLGLIHGSGWGTEITLLFGMGFMGAYTTFSTFKLESIQLGIKKEWKVLILYLGFTYTIGVILAFLGFFIGSKLKG